MRLLNLKHSRQSEEEGRAESAGSGTMTGMQKERTMAEEIRIALDAMGGDNAPDLIVEGAVNALRHNDDMRIILVGRQDEISRSLTKAKEKAGTSSGSNRKGEAARKEFPDWEKRISIRNASEVIGTAEHPVEAVMHKKDSSLVVGMGLVKKGEADAFVSAGNSGAVLVGGQGIIGRIRGVHRPPFATLMPTAGGVILLLDAGANVDARPEHLAQWAMLGTIYMENSIGIRNPKVGILNIGAEESKGNQLVKDTYPLLKKMGEEGQINFTGSVEARDVPYGTCDVVVCDGFAGNIIIKMYEGSATVLLKEIKAALMSTARSKIGALMIKPALKSTLKKFDATAYGGAPMLGLKGLVVKMHGSAKEVEVERAMEQCVQYYRQDIAAKITAYAEEEKKKQDELKKAGAAAD